MGLPGSAASPRLPSHYTVPYDQVSFSRSHYLSFISFLEVLIGSGVFLVILRVGLLGLNRCDPMMQVVMM